MFDFDSPTPSESSDPEASDKSAVAIKTNSGANRFLFQSGASHKQGHLHASRISHSNRTHTLDTSPRSLGPASMRKEHGQDFPELRAELNQAFSIRDIQVPVTKQTSTLQGNPVSSSVGNPNPSAASFATNPTLYSRYKGIGKAQEDRSSHAALPPMKHAEKAPTFSKTETTKFKIIPPTLANSAASHTQRHWNVATGFSYADTAKRRLLSPAGEDGTLAKRPSMNQNESSPHDERHLFKRHNLNENINRGVNPLTKPPLTTIQPNKVNSSATTHALTDRKQRRNNFKVAKENSISQANYTDDAFWFNS